MSRPLHKLSAVALRSLPQGKHNDGAGLWIFKRGDGSGHWVLRYTVAGRRREMGLGGYPEVPLRQARELASRYRHDVREGTDPIRARQAQRHQTFRKDTTFAVLAAEAFEVRRTELKGEGKAGRWMSPLAVHVLPVIGNRCVEDIDQNTVHDVLAPLWHTKADTARKALNRINIVLRHAAAKGLDVDLQTVLKTRELLGRSRHQSVHIPSMHWSDVPSYYLSLDEMTPVHLALRLVILTGARSGMVRQLELPQIEKDIWTIPGASMKGRKGSTADFRIPLSDEAIDIIEAAKAHSANGILFPGAHGHPISDMSLSMLMRRQGLAARPHGFRASLRVWLSETTDCPHEVAETMLAHVTGNKVTRAYQRTDFLEQRRFWLQKWTDHVTSRSKST